jgi:hypothetical protein
MAIPSPARPGTARPGLTVSGRVFAPSGTVPAKSTATVTDPRDGTATVT